MKVFLVRLVVILALSAPLPALAQAPTTLTVTNRPVMVDLIPTFLSTSMEKSVAFYANLGFVVVLEDPGKYVAVGRDTVQIGLAAVKATPKGSHSSCYVKMSGIEGYYQELRARAVRFTSEIKTQPSKMREFSVTDPDGNVVTFGEYVGQPEAPEVAPF